MSDLIKEIKQDMQKREAIQKELNSGKLEQIAVCRKAVQDAEAKKKKAEDNGNHEDYTKYLLEQETALHFLKVAETKQSEEEKKPLYSVEEFRKIVPELHEEAAASEIIRIDRIKEILEELKAIRKEHSEFVAERNTVIRSLQDATGLPYYGEFRSNGEIGLIQNTIIPSLIDDIERIAINHGYKD